MRNRLSVVLPANLAFVLIQTVATGTGEAASQSPYAPIQGREIKALSQEQIAGYESGQGMGLALAAELNGYPGPKHVLELRAELGLTEAQLQSTEAVFNEMKQSASELGRQIVQQERELDRSFASHAIDAESLGARIERIARLQGQLRTVHLRAHLEMMKVLNGDQVSHYVGLRGYHQGGHQGHHPDRGQGEQY